MAAVSSPNRPPIIIRSARFDFSDVERLDFFQENPVLSAFVVAISTTFPPGEAEFIRSVRALAHHVVDPVLSAAIGDFVGQEGQHAGQHRALNAAFDRVGYAATQASSDFADEIAERVGPRSDLERLATTVVMEHVTASLANAVLRHPEILAGLPQSIRHLLLWHAIEEIEHKSIAYEVYRAAGGNLGALRLATLVSVQRFSADVARIQWRLLRDAGIRPNLRSIVGMTRKALEKDGLVRGSAGQLGMMLRAGFHPWDRDDAALANEWAQRLKPHWAPAGSEGAHHAC